VLAFSEAINKLGVIELPLARQTFTWSNKKQRLLLERLDWFFKSQAWSMKFLSTRARTLTRDTSDLVPCAIHIKTEVPKSAIFRFENFWLEHNNFRQVFKQAWEAPNQKNDPAFRLTTKLKLARKTLKEWHKNNPKLATTIENTKLII
jgi:hypothetical protein